jgi:hypothetical protein
MDTDRSPRSKRGGALDGAADMPAPHEGTERCALRRFVYELSRPSWEEVEEYVREGRHSERVEEYEREDPVFAEILRWMRHEAGRTTPVPPSGEGRTSRPRGTGVS